MKPIFSSKTVWFNILTAVIAILAIIPQFIQAIGLPPHATQIILEVDGFLSAAGNIILRVFFTKIPIEPKV